MEDVKFSVLMSVYYKENPEYLKQSIESIINQTLIPNEFIIIKDGPLTEELNNCLNFYEQKYDFIKTFQLEKNCGLGIALNEGLKYCKYDYVARMDSDDISLLNRFEKQICYLKGNPDIDVLGGNIMEFDSLTNNDLSLRIVPYDEIKIKEFIKKRNPMNHVSVIFKKQSVVEAGGYLDCPYFEDYYLWARMLANGKKLSNINEVLVRVRAGLEMSARRGNFKYIKSIVNFENKLKKMKLISIKGMFINDFVRIVVAIMPNKLRNNFYQRKLRK